MKDTALPKRRKAACRSKRRGNPDWGKFTLPPKAGPTEFEKTVKKLRLSVLQCGGSLALKNWVRRNKALRYVPPELLKEWGFSERSEF